MRPVHLLSYPYFLCPSSPFDPPRISYLCSPGLKYYSVSADLHRSASWSKLYGCNYSSPRGHFSLNSCPSKDVLGQSSADQPNLIILHVMLSHMTLPLQCVFALSDHLLPLKVVILKN